MRRALTIESRDEKLFVHYATVLLDQHKVDEAAAANERALALNADNHDAVNLAGRIAFERGDLAAALAHYRRALALKPDLADAYNNMGNVLKELGQLEQAQDAYLRSDPARSEYRRRLRQSRGFAEIRSPAIRTSRRWKRWPRRPRAYRRPIACSSISRSARPTAIYRRSDRSHPARNRHQTGRRALSCQSRRDVPACRPHR